MDKINWKVLDDISRPIEGASGVYLLEWEDGTLKYGSADDIHSKADEMARSWTEQTGYPIVGTFGTVADDPEAIEYVIGQTLDESIGGWIIDGTSIKEILRNTQGKSLSTPDR